MFWLGKSTTFKNGEKVGISPIEYIILAHLRRRELINAGKHIGQYGKELMSELNKLFHGSWEAQSGTIYPILNKLEKSKKYLGGVKEDTGLGPKKKVYRLTEEGRDIIDRIVKENFQSDEFFIQRYLELLETFKDEFEREDEEPETLSCLKCGLSLNGAEKFCPECGLQIPRD